MLARQHLCGCFDVELQLHLRHHSGEAQCPGHCSFRSEFSAPRAKWPLCMQEAASAQGSTALVYQKLFPAEYFDSFVAHGRRPDGRQLQAQRNASVHTGVVSTARASAAAYIGATNVVAGISLDVAAPALETPDLGKASCKARTAVLPFKAPCFMSHESCVMQCDTYTQASMLSHGHMPFTRRRLACLMASIFSAFASTSCGAQQQCRFEGMPALQVTLTSLATFEAHFVEANALSSSLSHLLSQHLLSPQVTDLKQLSIASGKHCWHLSLDVYVLNNDGCLLDACVEAGVAALQSLKVCFCVACSCSAPGYAKV